MEKLTVVGNFTKSVEMLRNTECSRKDKLNHFHNIYECILSPSMTSHVNYAKHCSSAISVLLFFCEDLDSIIRMNAEENLNKIIRSLEATRVSRVLLDLFSEIRKNGNERSLRICLNLFAHYCPRIKEKNLKWYALKIIPCLQAIATRKETLLNETLCEFVKSFSKYLLICLNVNETCKLMEVFLTSMISECAVKRRCSSQNCISLIENSTNKIAVAKYGLKKTFDLLINDQQTTAMYLGVLGFLRLLLPIIISESICDCKQIIEIYDFCLLMLNNHNHSIVNASLEVINSILSQRNGALEELFTSHQLHHNEFLKKRKSLKNQIFQLKIPEMTCTALGQAAFTEVDAFTLNKHQPSRKSTSETVKDAFKSESPDNQNTSEDKGNVEMRFEISELEESSKCNKFFASETSNIRDSGDSDSNCAHDNVQIDDKELTKGFISVLEANEPQHCSQLSVERVEDKLQLLSDIDNESFNSIDFESEITIGEQGVKIPKRDEKDAEIKSQKSTDSIGSFISTIYSNAETMTKLFRPSTKLSGTATDSPTTSTPKTKHSDEKRVSRQPVQSSTMAASATTTTTITTATGVMSNPTVLNVAGTQTLEDDTISLESINSHISLGSHVSFQSSSQDLLRNEQDLVLVQTNDYENEKNVEILGESVPPEVVDVQQETKESAAGSATILLARSKNEHEKPKGVSILENFSSNENKFSSEYSSNEINIGTIYDQPLLYYTTRLIASKFLLAGVPGKLSSDSIARVSIKNLSLNVIANCVKITPDILRLSLEIDKSEISSKIQVDTSPEASNDSSSNEIGNDFDITEQIGEDAAYINLTNISNINTPCTSQPLEDNLLEMKDDHFGESNTTFYLNSPLSKSADPVLVTELKGASLFINKEQSNTGESCKLNQQLERILSKSEIIESDSFRKQNETKGHFTSSPSATPAPSVAASPSVLFSEKSNSNDLFQQQQREFHQQKQFVYDVLLFHQHPDPILRGDVQIIVGNFIGGSLLISGKNDFDGPFDMNRLLAICMKGFRDEIHTVVIQALSTFDRIFSLLMLNHFSVLCKQIESYQVGDDDDDEQFIENLLGTQFDVDQEKQKEIGKFSERYHLKNISAKLLLNQLCLCYDNKYWLVLNKYSEVISNLDYETIRELYGDDIASSYEATFVRQLLHLLGDDDTRVRDNTAESICRYIQTRYQKTLEIGTCYTNLNLLRDFLDHRIFHGIPKYLRYLFNDETKISIESANVLSKVLYLGTNELMELHNKNSQFGIINAIKVLLNNFNPVDYYDAWNEFNVVEVCLKFTYQNYITATDLNCQNDLIEITSKLLSANMLSGKINNDFLDSLLTHIMKILNIYFHLFSNRNPILFPKTQKSDLFSSTKELAVMNSMGYFGNDYLYIRIFNTLKSAFESYKITINKESGAKLMSLVTTCLRSLAVLLEFKDHSKSTNIIKLIEEILQYLTVLINYEPVETIGCLRQLLKFLFGRNYANRRNNYENFTKLYFIARNLNISNMKFNKNENQGCTEENANNVKYNKILEEIFASAMCFPLGKIKSEEECAKHIKMFEPLVIYCLPFFMKSNSIVQAPILDLLTQLLEFNVTYSILDSKNVIFDQVMKNLELIESGVARNSDKIINSIIKFLVSLSKHGDNKLVSIPKIISIINNLLANNSIRECSVLALKGLAFEIFFNMTIPNHPDYGDSASLHAKELNTQKEVMLGMLEKFIGSLECQKTLSILLLWNKVRADVPSSIQEGTVYSIVTKGLVDDKIKLRNLESFFVLDSLFKNIDKSVLLDAIGFPALLSLFMTKKADNFNDLSYITIILDNVILNAEEIYLVNHIKLFMKNHQSSSSTNEINHFIKVLNEKLDTCLSTLIKCPHDNDFCLLVVKFVRNLWKISNWDAINSTFRRELTENFFYGKFCLTTSLSMEYLQVEILKALCEMNLDKISMLVQLQKFGKRTVRRALLKQVCRKFNNTRCWTDNEVQVLFSDEFLSIIVEDKFKLVQHLCEVPEFSTLILQRLLTISQNIKNGDIHFVIKVISRSDDHHLKVALLSKLRNTGGRDRVVEQLIERSMMEIPTGSYLDSDFCEKRRKSKTNMMDASDVDENWMINQVIQLSSTSHPEEYARILLDIKSELKLKSIFSAEDFNNKNVLRSCINTSFQSMIQAFQNDCIQYSPHINYMNMNSLAKISINTVIKNLATITVSEEKTYLPDDFLLMLPAVTVLMEKISELENIGLQYVEYKFVKKFVNENILKTTSIIEIFINAIIGCCIAAKRVLKSRNNQEKSLEIDTYFKCIDAILKQEIIWLEINQPEKYEWYLNMILDTVYYGMTKSIPNTIFLKRYKLQAFGYNSEDKSPNGNAENVDAIQKAIFIGKLIEAKIDTDPVARISSMNILNSVAITLLRTDKFYMYAVTPIEIFQSFVYDKPIRSNCKLPSIPVEHLSDVEILQKFVRRLSIFGFSARQQFEEFFMTFLLLINKVYDENMVDVQEQFQIKSTCLAAILELLIRCKTFPYVGNKLSQFHHTTRWSRIKCDSISLKKLHKIHLLLPGLNAFSLPNLERDLTPNTNNNIIGTNCFQPNQYSLNFIWHMMESFPVDDDVKVDTFNKNFRYFTEISEIDLTSSSQLIFDVLTQLLEQNHVLVLPNLVKFCEICDNRDQIKWINSRMLKLQESISIDDTISHQYIIYLLCKTQSILVPCYSDLSHLCSVISTYLRSSHVFIRNATLHGLLSLLECCSKTNTTIGKLSEELSLLRDLIVGYINRHGIIEESSALFSDIHTKLVWALNFSLVEMTTKFVPECHLLANSIISANNLLKRTTNEGVYLCILHGLERVIVIRGGSQAICDKIEKLALELVKLENERFCLPALKLLLSCMYIGSSKQLENTELSNGIVQDDPEIIAQQTEKVDVLLHCIKSSTSSAARIYGEVLCQIIRDLVPPNEILTKVIKEFLAINQPHCGVIARIVYQVFRSAIDSSFLHMLQDWLICSLPTFITLPEERGVWCLTVIFLSASINLHLIKLFPVVLYEFRKLDYAEISLFVTSAQDFHGKLNADQKKRFKEVFEQSDLNVYKIMMKTL